MRLATAATALVLWTATAIPGLGAIARPQAITLSLVEARPGGCAWQRFDPQTAVTRTIARFPQAAEGARVAWAPRGDRALVWFDPERFPAAGVPPSTRLWEVALPAGTRRALALPALGHLEDLGYTARGEMVALTLERPAIQHGPTGDFLRGAGRTFPLVRGRDGTPCLVRAYRRAAAGWRQTDVQLSSTDWDYGMGVKALAASRTLGQRSSELLDERPGKPVADAGTLARLKAFDPKLARTPGEWHQWGDPARPVYVWDMSAELLQATSHLALGAPGGRLEAPPRLDLPPDTMVELAIRERYLLVATAGTGGARPRLYDLQSRRRVFASESAKAACFWPQPDR